MLQSSITTWLTKTPNVGTAVGNQRSNHTSLSSAIPTSPQPAATNTGQEATRDESGEQSSTTGRALSTAKLLPNVELSPVTEENLPQFRRLVSVLLPATYTDKFYAETLTDAVISSVTLLALWKDGRDSKVVAGIRCRVFVSSLGEPAKRKKDTPNEPSLYISTIGTLAPFRNHGLATILLRDVMWRAVQEYDISTVTAHVWEANEEAKAWYAKLGFQEVKYESDYYRKLRPSGAWLLERRVLPSDFINVSEEIRQRTDVGLRSH
jgi:N-alpha-acetyltransferase 50